MPASSIRGIKPLPPRYQHDDDDDAATRELHPSIRGYRLGTLLGRGGTSVVFAVTNPFVNEPIAMKVIVEKRLQDDHAAAAIRAHAAAVAVLQSPHVVRTIDAGRFPSGEPFVVMEHVLGEDLAARLVRTGALPIAEALHLIMQVCAGLEEAHASGIVHGDLEPGNLLLATDAHGAPCVKIIDFSPVIPGTSNDGEELVTFSLGYAAPEQLTALDAIDARADVWALGIVLHELVTGARPFDGTTIATQLTAMTTLPGPMKNPHAPVPPSLDAIVHRCLTAQPEARFATAGALREALSATDRELLLTEEARLRAAPTARRGVSILPEELAALRPHRRNLRRNLFFAALGSLSAALSLGLVRAILAFAE